MNFEHKSEGGPFSRVDINDALDQYPESDLLQQVEALSKESYSALYNVYNQGKIRFTFLDFAFCENTESVSSLLKQLEAIEDETKKREIAEQIAAALPT